MNIISEKIGGYVAGQLIAVSSIGIIMTIGLILLGVDYGFLLGLITAILDFIPVVGPAIGLAICIIACYETGGKIIVGILVIFAIAQIVENNLVRPYVFSKLLNLLVIILDGKIYGHSRCRICPCNRSNRLRFNRRIIHEKFRIEKNI